MEILLVRVRKPELNPGKISGESYFLPIRFRNPEDEASRYGHQNFCLGMVRYIATARKLQYIAAARNTVPNFRNTVPRLKSAARRGIDFFNRRVNRQL